MEKKKSQDKNRQFIEKWKRSIYILKYTERHSTLGVIKDRQLKQDTISIQQTKAKIKKFDNKDWEGV